MEVEKVKEIFEGWEADLLSHQKKYIHFMSMRNFVFHYDSLPNSMLKEKINGLLSNYIEEVQENYFDYRGEKSYRLFQKYIEKLSGIYRSYLGFKHFITFKITLLLAILGDGISYFFLKNIAGYWFPVISLLLLSYYVYIKIFYERKGRIFGLFY